MPHPADSDTNRPASDLVAVSAAGQAGEPSPLLEGLVVAISHGFFHVVPAGTRNTDAPYLCTVRKRLVRVKPASPPTGRPRPTPPSKARPYGIRGRDLDQQPEGEPLRIAVGERVRFRVVSADQGVIEELLPRHGAITRARSETGAAQVLLANADHAGLVFAVREPEPHFGLLDRYLSLCERAGVDVTIIFNKVDLGISPEIEARAQLYRNLGYTVVYTSATTGEGLDILRDRLRGRVSLLTGPSGVGKSSLLNDLIPGAGQRTGTVSEVTGKGRHTTTGARLLSLPDGGWLADSAGIRELALWHVPPEDLIGTFVELRPYVGACRYEDCEHSEDEEGCAVRAAFSEGRITPERFASFERLLSEARETEMVQR